MISVEEFVERLCLIAVDRGPRRFPRKRKDRHIIMKSILMGMDSARTYTEGQVNEIIQDWNREVAPAIDTWLKEASPSVRRVVTEAVAEVDRIVTEA